LQAQESSRPAGEPTPEILQASKQINPSAIRAPIRFLADDLLEGRGPGTTADELVQLYLSTQLESFGLLPAGSLPESTEGQAVNTERTWIQSVPMLGVTTRNPVTFEFRSGSSTLSLRYFDDMIANVGRPLESVSVDNAEVVFVGYGIQAPEYD